MISMTSFGGSMSIELLSPISGPDGQPRQREARLRGLDGNGVLRGKQRPQSNTQKPLPPPPDRTKLVLSAWLDRNIPERDYLLGDVMCTTSRWFVIGETGIGKTLFGCEMGAVTAAGASFLSWEARRPSRVMFIDGELPVETFKERMELIATRYRRDISFYGYNREDLGLDGMPPLNTPAGQAWLRREIEAIKPDVILFDSIMCLLVGPMQEEATWAPMKPLVCELSSRRIAQVWFNHANDLGKSFGDKTREWEMDTVAKLSKVEGDETAIRLEFLKARLRTPKTAAQFAPLIIHPSDDWRFENAKSASGGKNRGDVEMIRDEFVKVYDGLADGVAKSLGLDGRSSVRKVPTAAIREELKDRGLLDTDEKGNIERVSRNHFSRAKKLLLVRRGGAAIFVERKGEIWRT
jgi:AAA domain